MYSNNNLQLRGKLTSNPAIKEGLDKSRIVTFQMAVTNRYFDEIKNIWMETKPQIFNLTAFDPQIVKFARKLEKDRFVNILGTLRSPEFKDNEGNKYYSTEIVATSIEEEKVGQESISGLGDGIISELL